MDQIPEGPACALFADDLAALAAGVSTGRNRADVLVHVDRCPWCAVKLEFFSAIADALLNLYPEADPGEGFAERVMDRIGVEQRLARRRPRTRLLFAGAAMIALLVVAAALSVVLLQLGQPSSTSVATAALQSSTGPKGSVTLTESNWLLMTMDDRGAVGTVKCRVGFADGATRVVGQFHLGRGYGTWAVHLPTPSSVVRTVTVLSGDGSVIASARIS
jgi:hypothetical protein